jgi:hypothetical protein
MLYMLKSKMFPEAVESMCAIVRDQAALGLIATSSLQHEAQTRMEKVLAASMTFLEDAADTEIEPPSTFKH